MLPEQREQLQKMITEGQSHRRIAKAMGISLSTIAYQLRGPSTLIFIEGKPDHIAVERTFKPIESLAKFQSYCPIDLWIVAKIPVTDDLYSRILKRMKKYKVRGCWYKNCEALSSYILHLKDEAESGVVNAVDGDISKEGQC
jgi:hypothetical protein